jgi:preprotein translocase subunit SecY
MGFLATANLPQWLQWLPGAVGQLQHGQPVFMLFYGALIIFFFFFYTSIVFNPDETAENLRKYGGFLPGISPGKRTAAHLDYVLTRLTVIGAAYIAAVCLLPEALIGFYKSILEEKQGTIFRQIARYEQGLQILAETQSKVEGLQEELKVKMVEVK